MMQLVYSGWEVCFRRWFVCQRGKASAVVS